MKKFFDKIWFAVLSVVAAIAIIISIFVIGFIVAEAFPFFKTENIKNFFFGTQWLPIDIFETKSFGAFNFIAGSLCVSFLAICFSLILSIGSAMAIVYYTRGKMQAIVLSLIDLLASIPSVVYGFLGIVILVKIFLALGSSQGVGLLPASIVLSIMLLPYMISILTTSFAKNKNRYLLQTKALGMSDWYSLLTLVLPSSTKGIVSAVIMALGRAMGETMAVMMVMGNANVFPTLFGKGESIASVIALEMGGAVYKSMHYHSLYALGAVLLVLIFICNLLLMRFKDKI